MKYQVISTDDHLQELPDTFSSRMSRAKWGDKIPHLAEVDGGLRWVVWGAPQNPAVGFQVLGATVERTDPPTRWEDVPREAYLPSERIKAMDRDGVDVHTFHGNYTRSASFSNPAFPDAEFRLGCIRAYNDFQIDEYADPYPGRFITLAVLPLWDVDAALAEAQRMARCGVSGITFAFPQQFGYPHVGDTYWDPLWAFAQEAELSINFHIGSGTSMGILLPKGFEGQDPMAWVADSSTQAIGANTQVMSTLLFAGFLERFPRLKIVSAESGIGWVPYLLEVADHQWERQRLWKAGMPIRPSEYFHRQCHVNFWFEVTSFEMRSHIGLDNIMWLSDFPHPTCTWPTSREYIDRSLASLTEDERRRILVDTPVKLYHLDRFQN